MQDFRISSTFTPRSRRSAADPGGASPDMLRRRAGRAPPPGFPSRPAARAGLPPGRSAGVRDTRLLRDSIRVRRRFSRDAPQESGTRAASGISFASGGAGRASPGTLCRRAGRAPPPGFHSRPAALLPGRSAGERDARLLRDFLRVRRRGPGFPRDAPQEGGTRASSGISFAFGGAGRASPGTLRAPARKLRPRQTCPDPRRTADR